ncbi:MAG: flavodoxin family protein, partial [Oscillospiraceae bacterium]|nr:flavodoxin family protein [Oscillospiraceae bacterium]
MIVYYSGTGNSRHCAKVLAAALGDEAVDVFHYIKDGIRAELITGKPWVFVSPTYAWQLPRIVVKFLRSSVFEGSKEAYFVMTCGDRIGNAGSRIAP